MLGFDCPLIYRVTGPVTKRKPVPTTRLPNNKKRGLKETKGLVCLEAQCHKEFRVSVVTFSMSVCLLLTHNGKRTCKFACCRVQFRQETKVPKLLLEAISKRRCSMGTVGKSCRIFSTLHSTCKKAPQQDSWYAWAGASSSALQAIVPKQMASMGTWPPMGHSEHWSPPERVPNRGSVLALLQAIPVGRTGLLFSLKSQILSP